MHVHTHTHTDMSGCGARERESYVYDQNHRRGEASLLLSMFLRNFS